MLDQCDRSRRSLDLLSCRQCQLVVAELRQPAGVLRFAHAKRWLCTTYSFQPDHRQSILLFFSVVPEFKVRHSLGFKLRHVFQRKQCYHTKFVQLNVSTTNRVLTATFIGVETCNAEWQSRGVPEIILKSLAVHISTLVLVAEYATSLNMPHDRKACFVLGAAIYPTWTTLCIFLRSITTFAKVLWLRFRHRKASERAAILFSRAIGMYAEALHERDEFSSQINNSQVRPPAKISLLELDHFRYHGRSTSGNVFVPIVTDFPLHSVVNSPGRTNYLGRLTRVCLTLAYLVQAVLTFYLVLHRLLLVRYTRESKGLPLIIRNETMVLTNIGMITFADAQAFQLSALGVLVAFIYIALQVLDLHWNYDDNDQIWTFDRLEVDNWANSIAGMGSAWMTDLLYGAWVGAVTIAKTNINPNSLELWVSILSVGFCIGSVSVTIRWDQTYHRPAWLARLLPGWLIDVTRTLLLLPPAFWFLSFEYKRQFPVLNMFVVGEPNGSATTEFSKRRAKLDHAIYLFVYFAPGIALFIYHIIDLAQTLSRQSGISIPAVTAQSGCVYTTQLYPWMWKDPLRIGCGHSEEQRHHATNMYTSLPPTRPETAASASSHKSWEVLSACRVYGG